MSQKKQKKRKRKAHKGKSRRVPLTPLPNRGGLEGDFIRSANEKRRARRPALFVQQPTTDYQVPPLQPLVPPAQVRLVVPSAALMMLKVPPDLECALTV